MHPQQCSFDSALVLALDLALVLVLLALILALALVFDQLGVGVGEEHRTQLRWLMAGYPTPPNLAFFVVLCSP